MAVLTKTRPADKKQTGVKLSVPADEANLHEVAEQLHRLLATTYRTYNATQMAHWNVEGPSFHSLHNMFEEQYQALSKAVDEIAERIRAIGFFVNGGLAHLMEFATPQPMIVTGSSERLLSELLRQHNQTITEIRLMLRTAQDADDEATADMLIKRLNWHEDAAWMIRSTLGKPSSNIRPTPGFKEA